MTIRVLLTSGAIAAALLISACHKEAATPNGANATTELSNMGDTNANDEMMNEDAGNAMAANAQ
jgi:hypothetical protein